MTREQLIGLIASSAKFMDEREDITAYINTLEEGEGLNEKEIREGYEAFKTAKSRKHGAALPKNTDWKPRHCKPLWTVSWTA